MARCDLVQLRRGTEAEWVEADPLASGEVGLVVDDDGNIEYFVVGADGVDFADLPPFYPGEGGGDGAIMASTLTTNGDILTRASGVPARITRADLAEDAAFSGRYAPLLRVYARSGIHARAIAIATFTDGAAGRWPCINFPESNSGDAVAVIHVPEAGTYTRRLWVTSPTTATGDVRWSIGVSGNGLTDSATLTALDTFASRVHAAPGQWDVLAVDFTAGALPAGALSFDINRLPTDATDTLAAAIQVLAFELIPT